ncbi:hypothetical protein CPC08DRAFT_705810 [Agrocybe pediades]|nr:hypothetical protein CPC08DRAFT_705810 [Agrocybe pediades]
MSHVNSGNDSPESLALPMSPKQSSLYWYEDGNMVLEVESKIRYRVHKAILSNHSTFFKNLFLVPQTENPPKALEDGVPIVEMPTDREEDWERMLEVIYHPFIKFPNGFADYTLPTIIAVLRLGHKYQFDRLEELARKRVEEVVPESSGSWLDSPYVNHRGSPGCHPHDTIFRDNEYSKFFQQ